MEAGAVCARSRWGLFCAELLGFLAFEAHEQLEAPRLRVGAKGLSDL